MSGDGEWRSIGGRVAAEGKDVPSSLRVPPQKKEKRIRRRLVFFAGAGKKEKKDKTRRRRKKMIWDGRNTQPGESGLSVTRKGKGLFSHPVNAVGTRRREENLPFLHQVEGRLGSEGRKKVKKGENGSSLLTKLATGRVSSSFKSGRERAEFLPMEEKLHDRYFWGRDDTRKELQSSTGEGGEEEGLPVREGGGGGEKKGFTSLLYAPKKSTNERKGHRSSRDRGGKKGWACSYFTCEGEKEQVGEEISNDNVCGEEISLHSPFFERERGRVGRFLGRSEGLHPSFVSRSCQGKSSSRKRNGSVRYPSGREKGKGKELEYADIFVRVFFFFFLLGGSRDTGKEAFTRSKGKKRRGKVGTPFAVK